MWAWICLKVPQIQVQGQTPLTQIAFALGGVSTLFGSTHRGQEQCRQNGSHGNDNQKLDERKARPWGPAALLCAPHLESVSPEPA